MPKEGRVVKFLAACVSEAMLVDRVELRPADREEIEQDPENQPAIVEPEGPPPGAFGKRMLVSRDIAEAEVNKTDPQ